MRERRAIGVLFRAALAIGILAGGASVRAQSSQPGLLLQANSPLASDGTWIYGVAEGGRTLLRTPIFGLAEWKPVPLPAEILSITGVASLHGRHLFVSDAASHAVWRVSPEGGSAARVMSAPEVESPGEMAVVGEVLFVTDPVKGILIQIPVDGGTARELRLTDAGLAGEGPVFLAPSRDQVVLASPGLGRILQVEPDFSFGRSVWETRSATQGSYGLHTKDVVPRQDYPQIGRPGSVAVYQGVVYVLDAETGKAYASARNSPSPVRLPLPPNVKPTRLLADGDRLFLLDGNTRALLRLRRMVPAEVAEGDDERRDGIVDLCGRLQRERLLPTRSVPMVGSIEATLKAEHVLPDQNPDRVHKWICGLETNDCTHAGPELLIPDVYSESYVDVQRVTLKGDRSIGEMLDSLVRSPEFSSWRSEASVRKLNSGLPPAYNGRVLALRDGSYTLPVEKVRYLFALPADITLESNQLLGALRETHRTLTVRPLIELRSKASAGPPPLLAQVLTFNDIAGELAQMRNIISYAPGDPGQVKVGVVDKDVELQAPIFPDNRVDYISTAPPSGLPPAPAGKVKEAADPKEHGTSVASLIGGVFPELNDGGLAPSTILVPIDGATDVSAGKGIGASFVGDVRIFNLSIHFDDEEVPKAVRERISTLEDALFVVAAGNAGREVCSGEFDPYPVCAAWRKNVIVVAATDASGNSILPPAVDANGDPVAASSSNWSRTFVHVAAPGVGFHAAGRGNTYVPVRGSSFAAPLVTATAAVLYGEGIDNPARIKDRIIATADPIPGLRTMVKGGRLNFRRAVTWPRKTVLHKTLADAGACVDVALKPDRDSIWIEWEGPMPGARRVPLPQVLRLTRVDNEWYRIVYRDPLVDELLIQPRVRAMHDHPWKFSYFDFDDKCVIRKGASKDGELVQFADYIGPAK